MMKITIEKEIGQNDNTNSEYTRYTLKVKCK